MIGSIVTIAKAAIYVCEIIEKAIIEIKVYLHRRIREEQLRELQEKERSITGALSGGSIEDLNKLVGYDTKTLSVSGTWTVPVSG